MAKAKFLHLPDECICMVLAFLRPTQVKRVALTFNRRLFSIAMPFLNPLIENRRLEKCFESLFGRLDTEVFHEEKEDLDKLKFTDQSLTIPNNVSHHLEYLELKGDLAWLDRIAEDDKARVRDGIGDFSEHLNRIDVLVGTATRLGLQIPTSFIKFVKSETLRKRFPNAWSFWYIELGTLHKIRISVNDDPAKHQEGYIFTWLMNEVYDQFKLMYLDTKGRHAMLASNVPAMSKLVDEQEEEHWIELTDADKRERIDEISSAHVGSHFLEEIDFDRWLVNFYYKERIKCLRLERNGREVDPANIPVQIKRHLFNVYTEEGRMLQSRDVYMS